MARKSGFGTGLIRLEIRKGKIEMKSKKHLKRRQAERRAEKQRIKKEKIAAKLKAEQLANCPVTQHEEKCFNNSIEYLKKHGVPMHAIRKFSARQRTFVKNMHTPKNPLMKSWKKWKSDVWAETTYFVNGKMKTISFLYSEHRNNIDHLLKMAQEFEKVMNSDIVIHALVMRFNDEKQFFGQTTCRFESNMWTGEGARVHYFIDLGVLLQQHGIFIRPMFKDTDDFEELMERAEKELRNAA